MKQILILLASLMTFVSTALSNDQVPSRFATISNAMNLIMDSKEAQSLSADAFQERPSHIENLSDFIDLYSVDLLSGSINSDEFNFFCKDSQCFLRLTVVSIVTIIDFDGSGQPDNYDNIARTTISVLADYKDKNLSELDKIKILAESDNPREFSTSIEGHSILFRSNPGQ